ncbi:TIGR02679 family protein [Frankia sp. AiPs1]|uniref:TIGR02679 family protein n=1 Tax=Frankia sp. AiPa1 TaxID=573492 RepID=UPI00202BA14B|nr:TIGR02679 family protein [Frankia sp. AiPa1]MCL9758607.1 TIGR02679 family protein [Frankia sp. AiPa1]
MTAGDEDVDGARLARLFGPQSQWIVERARARLERGAPLVGHVSLPAATDEQRAAVAGLLGTRPRSGRSLRVDLGDVDAVVRRSGCAPSLAAAVVALTGPVTDLAAQAVEMTRGWEAALAVADPLVAARPVLAPWTDRLVTTGLLRRLCAGPEQARLLMTAAVAVVSALPVDGVPISVLAARVLGDGHGLDADRPLSTLILGAVALLGQGDGRGDQVPGPRTTAEFGHITESDQAAESGQTGETEQTSEAAAATGAGRAGETTGEQPEPAARAARSAEWRREAWAAVGVLVSELALPALVLGLPGDTRSVTGRALSLWREAGQPAHLSLRQLVRDPPTFDALAGRTVSVCENPTVVSAAADRLGTRCRPLVCVAGMPAAPVSSLLRLLREAGARLRYHGDFDWGGLAIAGTVIDRFGAVPWRYDRAHYEAALRPGLAELTGRTVRARFDPDLADALNLHRRRVEEEAVLDDLIADLHAA